MRKPDKKFRAIYAKGVPWDEKAAREFMKDHKGKLLLKFSEITPAVLKPLD